MLIINKENILKCRKKLKGKGIPKFSSPNSIIINMSVTVFPLYFNIVCVGLFLGYTPMTCSKHNFSACFISFLLW